VQGGPRIPGETFGPIFDEKTVFRDYDSLAKQGKFVRKVMIRPMRRHFANKMEPIFIGSNHNEGGLFQVISQLNKPEISSMNRLFTCLAAKSAAIRIPFNVPVWRYRFFDESPNNAIVPGVSGAYHAADLPFVYGTPKRRDSNGKSTDTAAEMELTKAMMTAWASFAKDPERGLEKLGYPKYDPSGSTLIQFGYGNKAVTFGKSREYDGECAVYEASKDSIDGIIALAKKRTGGKEVPFKLGG
jgi:carboxylesterase type B